MRQARLAALMWLTLLRRGSAAVPKAGGGGYAMAFDGLDGTTISLQWLSSPATQATVEYWIKLTDSHVSQQPLLAYSSYRVDGRDGLGGAPYENANELLAVHAPGFARFFRATISHDFQISAPYDLYERSRAGNWTHVAIVWSADPANGTFNAVTNATDQIAYYVNGELLTSTTACAYLACDMGMAIQPGGVLHLGQEADRPWGDFEELQGGASDTCHSFSEATRKRTNDRPQLTARRAARQKGGEIFISQICCSLSLSPFLLKTHAHQKIYKNVT